MKNFYLLLISVFIAACSKDDTTEMLPPEPVQEANFELTAGINRPIMNNIQVGERIVCSIKINNFDTSEAVVYVLKPITGNQVKHQMNRLDFYFRESFDTGNGFDFVYLDQDSIKIITKESYFYLDILKPGTFDHGYTLQKMNEGKYVSEKILKPLLFNAVEIKAWTFTRETANPFFAPNRYTRYYRFTIDDGEQDNDNYLTNISGTTHKYSVNYNGENLYVDSFIVNQEQLFKADWERDRNPPGISNFAIEALKIIQSFTNSPTNTIEYKYIPISLQN